MTLEQFYDNQVSHLSRTEQFQLATLILMKIPPESIVNYSEEWSEEDMRDATRYSLERASSSFGENNDA